MYVSFHMRANALRGKVILYLFLTGSLFTMSCASVQPPATELPPEINHPMRMGLEAAKLNEWALAIDYFREAKGLAPRHPQALYNLAAAYDHGKRDLLAIIWFRAYLAAAPGAENASDVRERIQWLEARVEAAVVMLLDSARETLGTGFTDSKYSARIVAAQAMIGDVAGAKATVDQIQDESSKSAAYDSIIAVAKDEEAVFQKIRELDANELDLWSEHESHVLSSFPDMGTSAFVKKVMETSKDEQLSRKLTILLNSAELMADNLFKIRQIEAYWQKSIQAYRIK